MLSRLHILWNKKANTVSFIVNFCPLGRSPNFLQTLLSYVALNDKEKAGLERTKWFAEDGRAYANEHATRPATIGAVLASSPTALLAW